MASFWDSVLSVVKPAPPPPTPAEQMQKSADRVFALRLNLQDKIQGYESELVPLRQQMLQPGLPQDIKKALFHRIQVIEQQKKALQNQLDIINASDHATSSAQQSLETLKVVHEANVATTAAMQHATNTIGARPEKVIAGLKQTQDRTQNINSLIAGAAGEFRSTSLEKGAEMDSEMAAYEAKLQAEMESYTAQQAIYSMPTIPTHARSPVTTTTPIIATVPTHASPVARRTTVFE